MGRELVVNENMYGYVENRKFQNLLLRNTVLFMKRVVFSLLIGMNNL